MNANLVELIRRLENLIRIGTIAEVDLSVSPPLCRVKTGDILTDWRPWVAQRAGSARTSWPPTAGEQVLLLSPSGDLTTAVVMPATYSDANQCPDDHPTRHRTTYPDGAVIEYDPEAGALNATGIQTATVEASTSVTVDCPETTCTGNATIKGDATIEGNANVLGVLTYAGGLNTAEGSNAGATINGPINHNGALTNTGSISSNGIVVDKHSHPGDGEGPVGEPI